MFASPQGSFRNPGPRDCDWPPALRRCSSVASSRVGGDAWLAILALVGEVDPQGTRRDALDGFLDQRVEEGYVVETRTGTHAVISLRPKGLKRFVRGADSGRRVVEVDDAGRVTMRPAEPRRR